VLIRGGVDVNAMCGAATTLHVHFGKLCTAR